MVLASIFGFISGIALGSFIHISKFGIYSLFIVSLVCFSLFYFHGHLLKQLKNIDKKKLIIFAIFLPSLSLGILRINISKLYEKSELSDFANKKVEAIGIVVDEPDKRETNTKLTVKLEEISVGSISKEVNEKILVTTPIYPAFAYGDKIKIESTLEAPSTIDSPDGRVFDYPIYLRARGIWYVTKFAKVELESSGHGALIKTGLLKIKNVFVGVIDKAISEPESSYMIGLLLGAKQSLGREMLSEFQRAGVSHVVVLSGYNIAIVAESLIALLSFLPKTLSFGFGSLGVILFTLLSGGGASAWRAAIMVLTALSAEKLNREYKASRALSFAILLMLLWNPLLLIFDPSFQLSILATIGLVFVTPFIEPYLKITKRFGNYLNLREIISSTIATQIVVLPYLIYTTGILSLVSLPVNILILGTIPITMFLGFLTGVVGIFSFYLSFIPAFFAYILLWYQLTIVHIGATLPYGAINLPAFSIVFLIPIYLGIYWKIFHKRPAKMRY